MLQLLTNPNIVDSKRKRNRVPIGVIILILTIAVADLVMISEIPFFVRNLPPRRQDKNYRN